MCGIFFCVENSLPDSNDPCPFRLKKQVEECLRRRGPDGRCNLTRAIPSCHSTSQSHVMHMHGHTLQLQGPLTLQPMVDSQGNMLMWNGEIFAGEIKVRNGENDGLTLLSRLGSCRSDDDVPLLMSKVKGPWSLIYWREESKTLIFGRDYFGRRSLLWNFSSGRFSLSSVALRSLSPNEVWEEVPADGLYMLQFAKESFSLIDIRFDLFPWRQCRSVPPPPDSGGDIAQSGSEGDIPTDTRVHRRETLPPLVEPLNRDISIGCHITEEELACAAAQLIDVLGEAVQRRVTNVPMRKPHFSTEGDGIQERCSHRDPASVAVLFSGGIDSMVLAALSDRFIPADQPIDLLNVAFEKRQKAPQKKKKKKKGPVAPPQTEDSDRYLVPDRVTGRSGLKELQSLNPERVWNMVEINVTVGELKAARQDRIGDLVYPLTSVLDDSIGCALWFASRGQGVIYHPGSDEEGPPHTSRAKVLLSGLGADEQLAGYARHRVHFNKDGWPGLLSQLEMELGRISSRNMGRDDRIISDHSREARFPYLDEDVVSYLNSLPVHLKADLSLPRGEGEKRLLRVAARKIGLTDSTTLPKRAIQFGSRIAKLENAVQKGSDVCDRLLLDQTG